MKYANNGNYQQNLKWKLEKNRDILEKKSASVYITLIFNDKENFINKKHDFQQCNFQFNQNNR